MKEQNNNYSLYIKSDSKITYLSHQASSI